MHRLSVARFLGLTAFATASLFVTSTTFAQAAPADEAFSIGVMSRGQTRVVFNNDRASAEQVTNLTAPAEPTALKLVEVECSDCQVFAAPAGPMPTIKLPAPVLRKLTQTAQEPVATPANWTTVSLSYLD